MPGFGLDQQEEIRVWEMGYAAAETAGYLRWKSKTDKGAREANPLAATAFVAGYMGGAFLGELPCWIENAFEPEVLAWIRQGYAASKSLNGKYVGKPYEANTGNETKPSEELGKGNVAGISFTISIDYESCSKEVEMVTGPLDEEMWRPVPYYPGVFVSNLGRVRDWKDFKKARMSRSHVYPNVEIPYKGPKPIHHIVAETWLGPPVKGLVICHNNDNKLDARVVNLRYDTQKENVRDRIRNRKQRDK
jgi:HNH endonuclease